MLSVLNITLPIFALIALGYLLTHRAMFDPRDMQAFGKLVVKVTLPALIFHAMTSRPLAEVADAGYLLTCSLATLATMALAWGVLGLLGLRGSRRTIGTMGVSCSNSGYMGYPILLLAYPRIAGTVLALQVVVENFVSLPAALILAETATPRLRRNPFRLVGAILLGILRRPMILGVIAGVAVNLAGLPVPQSLDHAVGLLAGATSAVALFTIGGVLAHREPQPGNAPAIAAIVAVKLLAMPALAAAFLLLLPLAGLPRVDPALQAPLVLSAAMPMFGIYPILARDYGQEGMAAVALLVATVASFFTLSAYLLVLQPVALP